MMSSSSDLRLILYGRFRSSDTVVNHASAGHGGAVRAEPLAVGAES
jgi:hypothetical protein